MSRTLPGRNPSGSRFSGPDSNEYSTRRRGIKNPEMRVLRDSPLSLRTQRTCRGYRPLAPPHVFQSQRGSSPRYSSEARVHPRLSRQSSHTLRPTEYRRFSLILAIITKGATYISTDCRPLEASALPSLGFLLQLGNALVPELMVHINPIRKLLGILQL